MRLGSAGYCAGAIIAAVSLVCPAWSQQTAPQVPAGDLARTLGTIASAGGEGRYTSVAPLLVLGGSQLESGKPAEARATFEAVIALLDRHVGPSHPSLVPPLTSLAEALTAQGELDAARAALKRAGNVAVSARALLGNAVFGGQDPFPRLVSAAWALDSKVRRGAPPAGAKPAAKATQASLSEDALLYAQWAMESAAGRTVAGAQPPLATPGLRQRLDLAAEWKRADEQIVAALTRPAGEGAKADEPALRKRMEEITARIAALDAGLVREHPSLLDLVIARPLPGADVRGLLSGQEVLLVYLPTPTHVMAWLVTRGEVRWTAIEVAAAELEAKIATLRCGLDLAAWGGADAGKRCRELTGQESPDTRLPFDLPAAMELYALLIAPFAPVLEGKTLLLNASGPLASLPFQVLAHASPGAPGKPRWLGQTHAIAYQPAISALRTARRNNRASSGPRAYLGIGNPVLLGPAGEYSAAWGAQSCLASNLRRQTGMAPASAMPVLPGMPSAAPLRPIVRNGVTDIDEVKRVAPLSGARDEICSLAASYSVGQDELTMGSRATEKALRDMSRSGTLRAARVVHLAAPALVGNGYPGLENGALVLTPPQQPAEDNDGLVTARELAGLRLDADWVILSGGSTAVGTTLGADPLASLSRAFFHTGARALVLSHWEPPAGAASGLVGRMLGEVRRTPGVSRAEALRRAVVAFAAEGAETGRDHPRMWASLAIVGDGGAVPVAAAIAPAAMGAPDAVGGPPGAAAPSAAPSPALPWAAPVRPAAAAPPRNAAPASASASAPGPAPAKPQGQAAKSGKVRDDAPYLLLKQQGGVPAAKPTAPASAKPPPPARVMPQPAVPGAGSAPAAPSPPRQVNDPYAVAR